MSQSHLTVVERVTRQAYNFGLRQILLTDVLSEVLPLLVQMELCRVITSEINDQQVIYLREVNGDRTFPILIGYFEASSINRRLLEEPPPRPLTHDLLRTTIEHLGGHVQDIVVSSLQDHTYYAVIRILQDGELIEVDARPSDAIALSVHYTPVLPVYVTEEVLEAAL